MENVVIFVFALAIMLSLILIVAGASITSFYQTATAQKKVIDRYWRGEVLLMVDVNGAVGPADKVLYITDVNNGVVTIVNRGFSDIFSLRLFCWDRYDPFSRYGLVNGEVNGTIQPVSIEVLPSFPPLDTVRYDLTSLGFTAAEVNDGNVACLLVSLGYAKPFVPRG